MHLLSHLGPPGQIIKHLIKWLFSHKIGRQARHPFPLLALLGPLLTAALHLAAFQSTPVRYLADIVK